MKRIGIICCFIVLAACTAKIDQEKDKEAIKKVLFDSAEEWSEGNIEGFMEAYWKSDKLQFIGKSGVTYGWQQTLDNYLKGYPTKEHTGKLTFKILSIDFLAKDLYSLTGEYHLNRSVGDANGIYTLIFKKIANKWVIISDHSE